jgi:hypothetical protein
MKKLLMLFVLGSSLLTFAQINTDQLSLEISRVDSANTEQLKQFIWKKASTVTVDGEVKVTSLSEFSFDDKGELQVGNIKTETTVKEKRGIRGRVQESNAEESVDYLQKALELSIAYTYMTKGQLLDFFGKAKITEKDGVIEATASDVYIKGDSLTIRLESSTKLFLSKKFSSMLGEDPINGVIEYAKFSSGISHASKSTLNLPGKNAVITSENKDYTQRVK